MALHRRCQSAADASSAGNRHRCAAFSGRRCAPAQGARAQSPPAAGPASRRGGAAAAGAWAPAGAGSSRRWRRPASAAADAASAAQDRQARSLNVIVNIQTRLEAVTQFIPDCSDAAACRCCSILIAASRRGHTSRSYASRSRAPGRTAARRDSGRIAAAGRIGDSRALPRHPNFAALPSAEIHELRRRA